MHSAHCFERLMIIGARCTWQATGRVCTTHHFRAIRRLSTTPRACYELSALRSVTWSRWPVSSLELSAVDKFSQPLRRLRILAILNGSVRGYSGGDLHTVALVNEWESNNDVELLLP